MQVTIISPEKSIIVDQATSVVAPAYDGEVGILPRHAPFMTLLGHGVLTVRGEESTKTFRVRGGFLQVADDLVRVVAQHAEGETDGS